MQFRGAHASSTQSSDATGDFSAFRRSQGIMATYACDLMRAFCLRWPRHDAAAAALSTLQVPMRDMLLIIGYRRDMKRDRFRGWTRGRNEAKAARANREEPSLQKHRGRRSWRSEERRSKSCIMAVCFTSDRIAFSPLGYNYRATSARACDTIA
jgi:hypothetical protein